MKKIVLSITGFLFISAVLISCGPTSDNASKYNDALVSWQTKVFQKESVLIEAFSKNMPDKLDISYEELVKQLKESSDSVQKIKTFAGKTDLKDAAMKVFEAYKDVTENDYPEMIKLAKTPDSLYTQETDDKVIEISKKIDDKLDKVIDAFVEKQEKFSEKYKFELKAEENEKK